MSVMWLFAKATVAVDAILACGGSTTSSAVQRSNT